MERNAASSWQQFAYLMGTPKPVIYFDWDGTLADSMPLCLEEVKRALEIMGLPPQPESVRARCNGPTILESVPLMGVPPERAEEYLNTRVQQAIALAPTYQRLFPKVRGMLQSLRDMSTMVIVSNGIGPYVNASLVATGVDSYFPRVQTTIPGKTKAELLQMLQAELTPHRAIMVGDRAGDLEAGAAAGLPTIAACYGYGSPEEWVLGDQQAYSVEMLRDMLLQWVRE